MRRKLEQEQGLDEDGLPGEDYDLNRIKDRLVDEKLKSLEERLDIDPTIFYAFTTDLMRIDVGLMIQRPPIFMRMREQDINFVKDRQNLMVNYHLDER